MANRVETKNAKNLTAKGQPSRMTCWLTAYEMLVNSGGYPAYTQVDVEELLKKGGFNVAEVKSKGLLDDDFVRAADALKLGRMLPGCLSSIGGVATKLQLYGVLWVALQIPKDMKNISGGRYPHIIIVFGVDEQLNQIGIVNPWKENPTDFPSKAWVDWQWFRNSLWGSESVDAGCQYIPSGWSPN